MKQPSNRDWVWYADRILFAIACLIIILTVYIAVVWDDMLQEEFTNESHLY